MVVGACSPIRHPDGTSHRSPDRYRPAAQPLVRGGGNQLVVTRLGRCEVRHPPVEQAGVQPTGHHIGIGQQEAQELDVGGHAQHGGVGERAVERAQRRRPVVGMRDHLRQHRVVVAADHGAARQAGIDADTRAARLGEVEHVAAGRQEAAPGSSA